MTMITPSYLGETIEYSSLHACRSTLEDPTVLKEALSDHLTARVMLALCAIKVFATVSSYSSGGAGGIFAPALFIGAMLGGTFGSLDRSLFHHPDPTLGAFALVGMGAVFAGTVRAPMTSVLIIIEMTSGYGLILPLMIANMIAYAIARHWRPEPIYEALLAQDGVHLQSHGVMDALEELKLDKLVRGRTFASLAPASQASEMILVRVENAAQSAFPVLDPEGRLLGVVTFKDLVMLESEPTLNGLVNAADLMRPPISVRAEDELRTALELMRAEGVREVPVLDEQERFVGFIDEAAIAKAYMHASAPKSVV